MHIPDGYLSPQTYMPLYIVFIVFIGKAIKKGSKKNLLQRQFLSWVCRQLFPFYNDG